ncbi:S26 family signal peptidase, partial [Streptomyces gelaticus]|uniref:S26 family signal peptidase n=1 Tax=Streptomyces gelaticus TaxID=285446 RepID=UPI001E3F9D09
MAAGARPGHEEPAKRPDQSAEPASGPSVETPGPGADGDRNGDRSSEKVRKQRPFWKELPLLIVIALVLALLIKTFLVQAFSIPSDSMQNTL